MLSRTIFLGKLLGLSSVAMFVKKRETIDAVNALMHDLTSLYVVALIILVTGLALVIGHNVWSGGALPVVVAIIGWMTLIKGLMLLFLPAETSSALYAWLGYEHFYVLYFLMLLVPGAYMTFAAYAHCCMRAKGQ